MIFNWEFVSFALRYFISRIECKGVRFSSLRTYVFPIYVIRVSPITRGRPTNFSTEFDHFSEAFEFAANFSNIDSSSAQTRKNLGRCFSLTANSIITGTCTHWHLYEYIYSPTSSLPFLREYRYLPHWKLLRMLRAFRLIRECL